ncbi:hypothetical protein QE411_000369 [Microbacterium arborescens]|nr:hypothetical protein [Microbacterium arborescens]
MNGHEPRRRLGEARGAEDLRSDVAVQPEEPERGELADASDHGLGIRQSEAELLVFVGRREEVVGLGVHAAVDPDEHRLHRPAGGRDLGEPIDLDEAVDDDGADPQLDGTRQLEPRLVVAVQPDARRIRSGRQRDGELTAGGDVDREPLRRHPADDLGAQERLSGVVHARSRAVTCGGVVERLTHAARLRDDGILIDHVERRAESLGQVGRRDTADRQRAAVVAPGAGRPDGLDQCVDVGGRKQPFRHGRADVGRGHGNTNRERR